MGICKQSHGSNENNVRWIAQADGKFEWDNLGHHVIPTDLKNNPLCHVIITFYANMLEKNYGKGRSPDCQPILTLQISTEM